MPMDPIEVSTVDNVTILKPEGEISVRTLVELRKIFEKTVKVSNAKIAIDCQKVKFLDSSGIGLLVNVSRRLKDQNGSLGLYGCNEDVKDIIYLSGIHDIIPIFNSFEEVKKAI